MCVSKPIGSKRQPVKLNAYTEMVQAAILSAKLHAPSLAPHVMYMHLPNQPFAEAGSEGEDALSRWLRASGVRVLNRRLSFYTNLTHSSMSLFERKHIATHTGACKMDIPRVAHDLKAELAVCSMNHSNSDQYALNVHTRLCVVPRAADRRS